MRCGYIATITCGSVHVLRFTSSWLASTCQRGINQHGLFLLTHTLLIFQNGRHFTVLLFTCKLALVASFLNSKFKRTFSFKREATMTNLQVNKRVLKWRPFWSKVYLLFEASTRKIYSQVEWLIDKNCGICVLYRPLPQLHHRKQRIFKRPFPSSLGLCFKTRISAKMSSACSFIFLQVIFISMVSHLQTRFEAEAHGNSEMAYLACGWIHRVHENTRSPCFFLYFKAMCRWLVQSLMIY